MSRAAIAILLLAALLVVSGSAFVVSEGQSAIIIQLGKVKRAPITEAGLYFKIPLFDEVRRFDSRVLAWDGDPERIPVKDDKFIFVDTFARWRVTDPLRFYNAVKDEQGAQSRLDDILDGSVRDIVSTHYLLELVRTSDRPLGGEEGTIDHASEGDAELTALPPNPADAVEDLGLVHGNPEVAGKRLEVRQMVFDICTRKLAELDLGIELVDLRIKRIDYTQQVQQDVYRRMISQQERVAERYRGQGVGKQAEIAGGTDQEQKRIVSESYRRSQEILGEAEAESTKIYAEAYNKDPEFYRFMKSLETYGRVLGEDDTLILSTDSDFLKYLKRQR